MNICMTSVELDAVSADFARQLESSLAGVRRQLKDAQDMLTGALNEGEPTKLHVTAHAVRDNLRTALAQLG